MELGKLTNSNKSNSEIPSILKNTMNKYDPKIASVFLPWAVSNPRYIRSFFRLRRVNEKAKKLRIKEKENGIVVPPFLILSITSNCNLKCSGCFADAAGTTCYGTSKSKKNDSLNIDQWRKIIKEASEIGVFGFIIAGGEPFLLPGLLDFCKEFKDRFFVILTNGTIINDEDYKKLKQYGNIAVIVSIEGGAEQTDTRRGRGVYEKAMNTSQCLNKIGVLNGISVTITKMNYQYWMNPKHIDHLISQGIRIGVFIEYIPTTPLPKNSNEHSDHSLILNPEERKIFREKMLQYRDTKQIYIVHSPGDEEFFGGCVSAGRGFAHVTPEGDLTPCPVSNIATHNLMSSSFRDGLASPLFQKIRENEHLLETEGMPCALFAHPKEVDELAKSVGAYRTNIK
jgi:MoaA/NifB/PqqE/SkfB family radical SAM enzyme